MALYIVGDVQGCFTELKLLLKQADFNASQDQLWLTGDLVARGPNSLETLRFVQSLGKSANFVLGNHDLHLLAIHAGLKKAKPQDKLQALIDAPDFDDLIHWLSQYPLLLQLPDKSGYMSHAGISPQWNIEQAVENAKFVHEKIASNKRVNWLKKMYGNTPDNWHDVQSTEDRFRFTINSLTRMRFCYTNGALEFNCKADPQNTPKNLTPWYTLSNIFEHHQWVIGHWAALMGESTQQKLFALDTGCVWGNHMTMLRWDDKKLFIQPAI